MPLPHPNRPSVEGLKHLLEEHPGYRSSSKLAGYLGVSKTTATRYLKSAGITPMDNREAKLIRVGVEIKIPSKEELQELIEKNPQYRSSRKLAEYYKVSDGTARNWMQDADIKPMSYKEAQLSRFGKIGVKVPSSEELRELIEEHPEYRNSAALGRYIGVNPTTAKHYLVNADIQPFTNRESNLSRFHDPKEIKVLSDADLAKLVEKHPKYKSATLLAEHLNVSDTSAKQRLISIGVKPLSLSDAKLSKRGVIRPSFDEIRQLVEDDPRYTSASFLGRHLSVSSGTASRYLIEAGIQPMNEQEAALMRFGKLGTSIPSPNELRQLIQEHPEYRYPKLLEEHLGLSRQTVTRMLRSIEIEPLSPVEHRRIERSLQPLPTIAEIKDFVSKNPRYRSTARLQKHFSIGSRTVAEKLLIEAGFSPMNIKEAKLKDQGKFVTSQELRKLVEENPGYATPAKLARYLHVSSATAKNWLEEADISPVYNPTKRIDFDSTVTYVMDYLFGEDSFEVVGKRYETSSMHVYTRDDRILSEIARRTGKTVEELKRIRDGKIELFRDGTPLETKVKAVIEYLSGSESTTKVGERYQKNGGTVSLWIRNRTVREQASTEMGIPLRDIEEIIKRKSATNHRPKPYDQQTKVDAVGDYLFGEDSLPKIAEKYRIRTPHAIIEWVKNDKVLDAVASQRNIELSELETRRTKKIEHKPKPKILDFDLKVTIVADYLFGEESRNSIAARYELYPNAITFWIKNKKILEAISGKTGMDFKKLEAMRDKKILKYNTDISFETKVQAVMDYLIGHETKKTIADRYEVSSTSIALWSRDGEILETVSKKTGKDIDVLQTARPKKSRREWGSVSDEEIQEYYHSNYEGLNGPELRKKDSGFYAALFRRKLTSILPRLVRDFESMSDTEIKQYYQQNYDGLGRGELQDKDGSFYQILLKRKLLDDIFPKAPPKIKTPDQLKEKMDDDTGEGKFARKAVEMFGYNSRDLADILALRIYQKGLDPQTAYSYLTSPSLGPWLGEFYKPSAHDMEEARPFILGAQLDTNEVLRGVFKRYGRRYYDSLLEQKSSEKDEEDVLNMLKEAAEKETDPDFKLILQELQHDYREIFSFRPSGLAIKIRR